MGFRAITLNISASIPHKIVLWQKTLVLFNYTSFIKYYELESVQITSRLEWSKKQKQNKTLKYNPLQKKQKNPLYLLFHKMKHIFRKPTFERKTLAVGPLSWIINATTS